MRIERLDLLSYGHLREVSLDLSAPERGLTVVAGPNEAGKSLTMRALLAALFGIPTTARDAYTQARQGLRIGALLTASDGQRIELVRQGIARAPLLDAAGSPIDPGRLERLLGGVGRELFRRLFSIDHDELRSRSEQLLDAGGEIGRLVFGAALGSGSIGAVIEHLEARAGALFLPQGKKPLLNRSLAAHRELLREARELRVRSREWARLEAAVGDADREVDQLHAQLQAKRIERARLERARRALPLLARRRQLAEELRAKEESGLVASREWARRAADTLQRLDRASSEHVGAKAAVKRLEQRIADLEVPEDLLAHAGEIDSLVKGMDRYSKDAHDLLERRGQLEGARTTLAGLLAALGLHADDGRLVAEADLATVEHLATRHASLDTALGTAAEELTKADGAIAEARHHLDELSEPPDLGALARAAELARPAVALERSLPKAVAELDTSEAGARGLVGRLDLRARSFPEIEALEAPSPRVINAEAGRREAAEAKRHELDTRGRRASTDRAAVQRDIDQLLSEPDLPDPERMATAREHRDAGWRVIRPVLEGAALDRRAATEWARNQPLGDSYESAVAEADSAADERYNHAGELAALVQLRQRLDQVNEGEDALAAEREQVENEMSTAEAHWRELWTRVGIEAGTPAEMSDWRQSFEQLLTALGSLREKSGAIESDRATIASHVAALAQALTALGIAPDADRLEQLVVQAEAAVALAGEQRTARRDVAAALERALGERRARHDEVVRNEASLAKWKTAWAEALQPLALPAGTEPSVALQAVRAYRDLPAARRDVRGLEFRIHGMERDIDAFRTRVEAIASGLIELDDRDPLDVAEDLRTRLAEARKTLSAREAFGTELETATAGLASAEDDVADEERRLVQLREEVGLHVKDPLGPVIDRSESVGALAEAIAQIEADLVQQGGGRTLDEVIVETTGTGQDGDALDASITGLDSEVSALEGDLDTANQHLGQAREALAAIAGSAVAADTEQEAEGELALVAGYASEFARAAVAAAVLRKAVADYGERHREPMLERAGKAFVKLTAGAFTELVPEVAGDRQVLLAKRRNGELLATGQLSDGTLDQLYLALRVAGIEYQLDHLDERVPVVLDDLLVNFDDERTKTALELFCDLGQRTQVLLFTHHEAVIEIARDTLDEERVAVVRLRPRDHDAPVVASRADLTAVADGSSARPVRSEEQTVLDYLRTVDGSLSKAEILSATAIDEATWPRAIRRLLDTGAVVQKGQKRGARYRLVR
jgi:uncharacterized protein YhaN